MLFSFLSTIFETVVAVFISNDGIIENKNRIQSKKIIEDYENESSASDQEEEDKENSSPNQQSFDGKVTSYFNHRGLVNDHIYFNRGSVIGNQDPEVFCNYILFVLLCTFPILFTDTIVLECIFMKILTKSN